MLSTTRRLAAVATMAVALATVAPPTTAGAALGPCRTTTASTGSEVAVVVIGHYVDSAGGDVKLTCHLMQGGVRVASVTDPLYGPVADFASDQRLNTTPFTVCHELVVSLLSGWGERYSSNCY